MEMQFFVAPGTELERFEKWKALRMKWHQTLGFGAEKYRFRGDKLAHYANAATDIEFEMPFGFKEVEGITRVPTSTSQHRSLVVKNYATTTPNAKRATCPTW